MKPFASILFAMALIMAPLMAFAETPSQQSAEEPADERTALEDRSASFQAVSGPVTEDVPGGTLLIAAYIAIWAATMFYLLRLARIERRLEGDLDALRESLSQDARIAEEGDV